MLTFFYKFCIYLTTCIIFAFLLIPLTIYAGKNSLIINEVMPNPIGLDSQFEWIEIFNNSNDTIDMGNWTLDSALIPSYPLDPGEYLILVRNFEAYPEIEK